MASIKVKEHKKELDREEDKKIVKYNLEKA